jgi:hypothetical protein
MPRITRFCGALIALTLAAGAARADQYYVVVFGAESKPQRPKFSHSWAVFVHTPGCDECGPPAEGEPVEWFVISWNAAKESLNPWDPLPEVGRNFDLPDTFRIVLSTCQEVSAWGPYEICPKLYCWAQKHKRRLESGEVRYKTVDTGYNPNHVSNCIHALTIFNTERKRLRIGRTNFGDVASYYITDNYRDLIINPCQTYCWVADLLGLGQYPIKWRTLQQGPPRLGE